MNTQPSFTIDYFCNEIMQFRNFLSDPQWFKKPIIKRNLVIKALTFVYLNVRSEDGTKLDQSTQLTIDLTFKANLMEYQTRALLLYEF